MSDDLTNVGTTSHLRTVAPPTPVPRTPKPMQQLAVALASQPETSSSDFAATIAHKYEVARAQGAETEPHAMPELTAALAAVPETRRRSLPIGLRIATVRLRYLSAFARGASSGSTVTAHSPKPVARPRERRASRSRASTRSAGDDGPEPPPLTAETIGGYPVVRVERQADLTPLGTHIAPAPCRADEAACGLAAAIRGLPFAPAAALVLAAPEYVRDAFLEAWAR